MPVEYLYGYKLSRTCESLEFRGSISNGDTNLGIYSIEIVLKT
jgi:hypothetical protein